jgi:putative membrane protein
VEVIEMKLLVRWVIVSLALFAAAWLIPGIQVEGTAWIVYAVMALVLGLVNAVVRPLLKFLTCPLIILTLGLFTLIINTATLWVSSWVAVHWLGIGFYIQGFEIGNTYVAPFWTAFLGALVVSIVTAVLSVLVKEDKKHGRRDSRDNG